MAGPHGSPPRHRPGHGSPPRHGHDGHGPPHSPPKHGHDGHGPPHSPPKHGHGPRHPHKHGHGDCKPETGDGGSIPIVEPQPVEPSGPYPEVVGLKADQATKIIQQKLPGAVVDVIVAGEIRPKTATVPNTVRLWLDPSGFVHTVEIPAVDGTTTGGGTAVPIDDNPTPDDGPYPEVIGLSPDEATAIVKQKTPNASVDVIPGGEIRPTLATAPNTVRLWLDHGGKVQLVEVPSVAAA